MSAAVLNVEYLLGRGGAFNVGAAVEDGGEVAVGGAEGTGVAAWGLVMSASAP